MSDRLDTGAVLCIGAAAADLGLRLEAEPILGTSNLATASQSFGGVARNIAELLARLGAPASLLTAVGDDATGRAMLGALAAAGVDASQSIVVPDQETARYIAVLDPSGELVLGVNAMRITSAITAGVIAAAPIERAGRVIAECNLDAPTIAAVIERCSDAGVALAVDTISVPKAVRLPRSLLGIGVLFTNVDEANALLGLAEPRTPAGASTLAAAVLDRGAAAAVVTMGDAGHVVRTADGAWWSAAVPARVVDVTGAGDALIAATIAGLHRGLDLPTAAREGSLAAAITAEAPGIAPPHLTTARLTAEHHRLDAVPMEGPTP